MQELMRELSMVSFDILKEPYIIDLDNNYVTIDWNNHKFVGLVIKGCRENVELSIEEVSNQTGISMETIQNIENGIISIDLKTAKKLAVIYNTDYRLMI